MTATDRAMLARDGAFTDAHGESHTRTFLEDARGWAVLPGSIAVQAPVRILQGGADEVVPWRRALAVAEMFESANVVFTLVLDGDHRMSRDADLVRLSDVVGELAGT